LHVVVFQNNLGLPSVPRAQVLIDIANANERLAQSTIRLVAEPNDIDMGGAGDPGFPQPAALSDGYTYSPPPVLLPPSADESAVLPFKDGDDQTIDVFYIGSLITSGAAGTSYPEIRNLSGNLGWKNWFVIASWASGGSQPNVFAHEVMHILLNAGHRDQGLEPVTALFRQVQTTGIVGGTKRIGPYPPAALSVGNGDTTTMRAAAETLP
jgi:hypothetical protein